MIFVRTVGRYREGEDAGMIGTVQGMLKALSAREGMEEQNIVTSSTINIKKARQKRGKREHKHKVRISGERQDTGFIYTRAMGRSGLDLQWVEYIE